MRRSIRGCGGALTPHIVELNREYFAQMWPTNAAAGAAYGAAAASIAPPGLPAVSGASSGAPAEAGGGAGAGGGVRWAISPPPSTLPDAATPTTPWPAKSTETVINTTWLYTGWTDYR